MDKWLPLPPRKRDTEPVHCVYLLWCDVKKEYYIGMTEDFELRLKAHKDKELPNHKILLENLMYDKASSMESYFINCPPEEVCQYTCINKQKNYGYVLDGDRIINYQHGYLQGVHYQYAVEARSLNPNLETYYYETVRKKYVPDKTEELMKEIEELKLHIKVLERNWEYDREKADNLEDKLREVRKMFVKEFKSFDEYDASQAEA